MSKGKYILIFGGIGAIVSLILIFFNSYIVSFIYSFVGRERLPVSIFGIFTLLFTYFGARLFVIGLVIHNMALAVFGVFLASIQGFAVGSIIGLIFRKIKIK